MCAVVPFKWLALVVEVAVVVVVVVADFSDFRFCKLDDPFPSVAVDVAVDATTR